MKTTLSTDGKIRIPDEIRKADHLSGGDSFELERLMSGHYLLTKQQPAGAHFTVATGEDGLPVIRTEVGVIASQRVKELESQTP
jgi:bifunctional DNA-binding transcriptional regulator/antitoxin component of YhaV-PrlF toxin-antitoxin module